MASYPAPVGYPFSDARSLTVSDVYERLRGLPTLPRVRLPFGEPAWLVIDYEQARFVLGDPRFSRAAATGRDIPRQSESPNNAGLLAIDPPDHTRLRSLISKAFTMRRAEGLRPSIRKLADRLAGQMKAAGPPADLVEQFGMPLSLGVIQALLGIPEDDREQFRAWSDAHLTTTGVPAGELARLSAEFSVYMAELIAARRRNPGDDLLTDLITARDHGDRLSDEELVSLSSTLLFAGYEAPATQIPNFVYFLLDNPGLWHDLRTSPERVPVAVEELLRYVPLMAGAGTMPRYAVTDVLVGGTRIAEGDAVIVSLGAGNRDHKMFPDPRTFTTARGRNRHLAFGHGPHHCVGAALARVELQESLSVVLCEFPDLRLAGEVSWKSHVMRGLSRMPVAW